MLYLLNAFVPPASGEGTMKVTRLGTLDLVSEGVQALARGYGDDDVRSFIGHEATARLVARALGRDVDVDRGEARPEPGDGALVFRLRRRLSDPAHAVPSRRDLEVWYVSYLTP